jgi:outer membrane protein OmpA-like peptidoglycan-associated protein
MRRNGACGGAVDRAGGFNEGEWGINVKWLAKRGLGDSARNWCICLLLLGCLVGLSSLAGCQSAPLQHGLSEKQIAALKDAGFKHTDEGWEFGLNDRVLFDTDRFAIKPQAQEVVTRVAHTLTGVGISQVRVYGYTDSTGADAYNEHLSQQRADAVADALAAAGMQRNGIEAIGAGERDPVADNSTAEGRAQNRRVAIVISTR